MLEVTIWAGMFQKLRLFLGFSFIIIMILEWLEQEKGDDRKM